MWKGYGYVLLAAAMWGCLGPAARFAFAEGATPLETAFWRAAFGAVLFGIHCLVRGGFHVQRKDLPILLGFGLVGVSVFFGSYQAAVKEGGAALASVLLYTAPAWVAILSRFFFGEIFTGRKLVALAGVLAGTLLLSLGGGGDVRPGVAAIGFGLLAGFTYALHFIMGKRYLRDYSGAVLYCVFLPVGALGLLPFVEFQTTGWIAWAAFAFLGLVCTYLAYICYCAGLKILAPTRVAVVATLEPVVAAFLAFTLWQEYFSSLGYVGGVLVLAGVVLMVLEGRGRGVGG